MVEQSDQKKFKAGEELRRRILEAASRLFRESGYEKVSIRNIAHEVGCSQMAMYHHFPDKESLLRYLCAELYHPFTIQLHEKFDRLPDPKDRLRNALRSFVLVSIKNPHHYRLTFLVPAADEQAAKVRTEVANPAISYFRENLKQALPPGTSERLVEERLHQILAMLHGMTVMLITHPRAYGLTKTQVLQQLDSGFDILLGAPADACFQNRGEVPGV